MNKELYLITEEKRNKERELFSIVKTLEIFLNEKEKNFKTKESINALNSIKSYLIKKEKELEIAKDNYKNSYNELVNTCNHEIALKPSNTPYYYCLVCEECLGFEIPNNSIISIDTTNDYKVKYKIEEIFKNIVHSDKDLIKTISENLGEIQYESDIKIYRRQL